MFPGDELKAGVTFSPMRTGWMPKNGLIAIAGTIGASSSAGRGAIQMPPVSAERRRRIISCQRKKDRQGSLVCMKYQR